MSRAGRVLLLSLALWALAGALLPARARQRTLVVEQATLTYYLPTGQVTALGIWPEEGATVGCGWEVPLGATVTFANGDTYLCADRGLTSGPWVDFFSWTDADGRALVFGHADTCPAACYATITVRW